MRMRLVFTCIFLVFALLLSRIYYLSIKSNIYYEQLAKQNAIKTQPLLPIRGEIRDSNGEFLAINELGFSVSIAPYLSLRKKNHAFLEEELRIISEYFPDFSAEDLKKTYQKSDSYYNQEYISVIDFIPYEMMIAHMSSLSLRERIKIEPAVKRKYPYGKIASHVIGYIGKSHLEDIKTNELARLTNQIGKAGIERYYNDILQGQKGVREVKVNALNQEIQELFYQEPSSNDLSLSIDIRLQSYLSEIFHKNAGAVVIMDVQSGAILAAGSYPEFDPNAFVNGISTQEWQLILNDPDHPFTNKLINGHYPPGSLVKMGVGLAFLNSKNIQAQTNFFCNGFVELGGRKFRCWNRLGHGQVDLKHAIKQSCDVYFYEGGLKVGIDTISQTLSRIGFGKQTGVDLPNEFIGTVPSREWKLQRYNQAWYQGETLNTSIGQGSFSTTPMQVARYTAQLATGKNVKPHFLKGLIDSNLSLNEDLNQSLEEPFTSFEKAQLPLIREAMLSVTNEQGGTAYRYFKDFPLKIAAKTGTAQVIGFSQSQNTNIKEEDLQYYTRSHTWLTSYAPYKNPKYVVTILLEHGGKNTTSGDLGVKIYKKLIELGYFTQEDF